jgi:hypothetical protein
MDYIGQMAGGLIRIWSISKKDCWQGKNLSDCHFANGGSQVGFPRG